MSEKQPQSLREDLLARVEQLLKICREIKET
jgi:hypothetical protein